MVQLQTQQSADYAHVAVLVQKDTLQNDITFLKSQIKNETILTNDDGLHDNILLVVIWKEGKIKDAYQPYDNDKSIEENVTRLLNVLENLI